MQLELVIICEKIIKEGILEWLCSLWCVWVWLFLNWGCEDFCKKIVLLLDLLCVLLLLVLILLLGNLDVEAIEVEEVLHFLLLFFFLLTILIRLETEIVFLLVVDNRKVQSQRISFRIVYGSIWYCGVVPLLLRMYSDVLELLLQFVVHPRDLRRLILLQLLVLMEAFFIVWRGVSLTVTFRDLSLLLWVLLGLEVLITHFLVKYDLLPIGVRDVKVITYTQIIIKTSVFLTYSLTH
jgi:hypothetical protein